MFRFRSPAIVSSLVSFALMTACATTPKKKHVAKKAKKHPTEANENFALYKQSNLNQSLLQRGQKNNLNDDKSTL